MTKLLSLSSLVVFASLSLASAQKDNKCEQNIKVIAQAHLDEIKSCKTFKGTIEINQMPEVNLRMEGVQELIGDLVLTNNGALQSFNAPDLRKVDGAVRIENHTFLNKLDLPQLTEANSISLFVLPALEVIQFPAGLSKVNIMRIEDTHAPKVDGFKPETIQSFTLTGNKLIKTFDFNSVKQVTGDLLIIGNNAALDFQATQLTSLNKAAFFNMDKLDLPALTQVRSDISFHENNFASLNMDTIEHIGGTVTIANNDKLAETSFKNLNRVVGALSIGNNTQLNAIDGFPKLTEIHGMVDLAGGFNSYSLPALQDVRGGMRLQTTSSQLGCSDIEHKMKGENIVKGNTWSCTASMQESNMEPTVGQSPSKSTTSGGSQGGSQGSSQGESSTAHGESKNEVTSLGVKWAMGGHAWLVVAAGFLYTAL